ncbi:unnamed protein product [Didymodactylos carnosus]|uniref:Tetratricopeptide repeat protein n=1 Tax=Didymodactylos carnosus TaxID=1234261 RepID=A0A8S2E5F3_9BILA|nr:unnamed protein product [Didymodactylos carnosus]CAF3888725.1 unnamed protein product [Didymodactylos carnosus]
MIRLTHTMQEFIDYILFFNQEHELLQYLKSINEHEQIFLVFSTDHAKLIIPKIHDIKQIDSIFILPDYNRRHKFLTLLNRFGKKIVICADLTYLLKSIQKRRLELRKESEFFVFHDLEIEKTLIYGTGLWYQLIKHVLLHMSDGPAARQRLLSVCNEYYYANKIILKSVDEFSSTYSPMNALEWYVKDTFLSRLLDNAFQVNDLNELFKFRFYIKDLCLIIHQRYSNYKLKEKQKKITFYRALKLKTNQLHKMRRSVGNFIQTRNFLFVNSSMRKALSTLSKSVKREDTVTVILEIDVDTTNDTFKFANVSDMSNHFEFLFDLSIVFRIVQVDYSREHNAMWIIHITSDDTFTRMYNGMVDRVKKDYKDDDIHISQIRYKEEMCKNFKLNICSTLLWIGKKGDSAFNITRNRSFLADKLQCFDTISTGINYIEQAIEETIFLVISEELNRTVSANIHDLQQISNIYIYNTNPLIAEEWSNKSSKIKGVFTAPDALEKCVEIDLKVLYQLDRPDTEKPQIESDDLTILYLFTKKGVLDESDAVEEGLLFTCSDHLNEAKKYFNQLIQDLPIDDIKVPSCYIQLGLIACTKQDLNRTLEYYQTALKVLLKYHSEYNLLFNAMCYNNLGAIYCLKQQFDFALDNYMKAFDLASGDAFFMALICNNISSIQYAKKNYDEALTYERYAIEVLTLTSDESNSVTLERARAKYRHIKQKCDKEYLSFASLLFDLGNKQKDRTTNEEDNFVVRNLFVWLGNDNMDAENNAGLLNMLSAHFDHLQTFVEVEKCEEAIKDAKNEFSEVSICLLTTEMFSHQIISKVHDIEHLESIYLYVEHSQWDREWTKNFGKVKIFTDLNVIEEHVKRDRDPMQKVLASVLENIENESHSILEALKLLCRRKYNEVESYLQNLINSLPENDPSLSTAYIILALVSLANEGDSTIAIHHYEKALKLLLNCHPTNYSKIVSCQLAIAHIQFAFQNYDLALKNYLEATFITDEHLLTKDLNIATCYENMGTMYYLQNCHHDAKESWNKCLEIYSSILPSNHRYITQLQNKIREPETEQFDKMMT